MSQQYIISPYSPQNEFGGCDVIIDVLRKIEMRGFIDSTLKGFHKDRSARAEYKYSEGILAWFFNLLCGGDCLEDMHLHRDRIYNHPRFHELPPRYTTGISPDTFSKICSELTIESTQYLKQSHEIEATKVKLKKKVGGPKKKVGRPKGKVNKPKKKNAEKTQKEKSSISHHEINCNEPLNKLLLKCIVKLGLLKRNHRYILDYDTSVIESKIADCRKWYKGNGGRGYSPAIASINNIPVYIENRNGDSPPAWNITETIDKIIKALQAEGILIDIIRVDGAAYNEKFIEYANQNKFKYVTRVIKPRTKKEVSGILYWESAIIKGVEVELGENKMTMRHTTNQHRIVIKHVIKDDTYWALITNMEDISKTKLCELYAERSGVGGAGEHVIQTLKGDFVCKYLPFRNIAKNTVFIGISAICYCIYKYLVRKFSKILKHLNPKMQLCTFIDVFVKGKTHWRKKKLFLVDKIARMYERLSGFT